MSKATWVFLIGGLGTAAVLFAVLLTKPIPADNESDLKRLTLKREAAERILKEFIQSAQNGSDLTEDEWAIYESMPHEWREIQKDEKGFFITEDCHSAPGEVSLERTNDGKLKIHFLFENEAEHFNVSSIKLKGHEIEFGSKDGRKVRFVQGSESDSETGVWKAPFSTSKKTYIRYPTRSNIRVKKARNCESEEQFSYRED